ncbi:bifunctional UDP-N-acetylglucosamine diphosphorylase/glucosamine-1-phosphate N-acetyltransferase GlmU [Shimazuella kribbensis]|uniref:bifunctional UDP-N-acetylglucosamine diphosphorylase/glucosamine-1-phosphate N-acetyltransferase GlmU n=1 Tax=Shimazuella kribbensis TaxID=139808 RepID=UPI000408E0CE|nr:bifunctional UDP-N-acetylglucosamine diphosphorylase/glucosamine-1-phosphate N-acetyltransferase GlmU [Shimazuella kribbensis]
MGAYIVKENLNAVILAAGKGTRMKSKKHKVLHELCGKPMIHYILDTLEDMGTTQTLMVIGHLGETLEEALAGEVTFVKQTKQLGTAHAVMQTEEFLQGKDGITLVLNGDHPLFTKDTLQSLIQIHRQKEAAATVLTAELADPTGYGRVIRQGDGSVSRIVEHKDATEEERSVHEINTGTYCFHNKKLFEALKLVNNNNAQGEYYLPDVISILQEQGEVIAASMMADEKEAMGVNDRFQLAEAEAYMQQRILKTHMLNGVTIHQPSSVTIGPDVEIDSDTEIFPGSSLKGNTKIGNNCVIGPEADLFDVLVADHTKIRYSVIEDSEIGSNVTVGPYAYIRPNTSLAENTKVGAFVDLKNAQIGKGSKVSHLAYVGDAEVGQNVNVACGVVTVNYDGFTKHKTVIKDGAFIGCNTNLVAPVTVEEKAYIAAGSTITDDVPPEAFAIARQKQVTKENYVPKLRNKINRHNSL